MFGAVASRSYGIYFLMLTLTYTVIAFLFVGSVTLIGGFSPVAGVDIYARLHRRHRDGPRAPLLHHADPRSSSTCSCATSCARRSASRSRASATSRAHGVAGLQRRAPPDARLRHRAFIAALGGVLYAWWFGQLSPTTMGLDATIQMLVIAVIGGPAASRARGSARLRSSDQQRDHEPHPLVGPARDRGTFNTVIGFIFLAIVIISPDGSWACGIGCGMRCAAGAATPRGDRGSEPAAVASS